ncbi:MAG: VanZ family protein [Lachnospiraceae bacterium]|nr:VanZ family protein [Lachnospiraceae bacterium]
MTNKGKKIFHIVITIAIMVFIFIQSALTADLSMHESNVIVQWLSSFLHVQPETLSFIVRKCAHFLEYLILGISMFVSVCDLSRWKRWKNTILAFFISAAYAATDELHQMFVQGRSCEVRDILIDSLGALLGLMIAFLISFLRSKKKQTEE